MSITLIMESNINSIYLAYDNFCFLDISFGIESCICIVMEKLEIVVGMIDSVRLINKITTNVLIFVKIICKIFK